MLLAVLVDGLFILPTNKKQEAAFEKFMEGEGTKMLPRFADGTLMFKCKREMSYKVPFWDNRPTLRRDHQIPDATGAPYVWACVIEKKLIEAGMSPDETQDYVVRLLVDNGGGIVQGPAGCGKSEVVKRLAALLEAEGHTVVKGAPTHAAAMLMGRGGRTLLHLINRKRYSKGFFWIVDEAFQASLQVWGQLASFQQVGCKFIMVGDPHQLPPVNDPLADVTADLVTSNFAYSLTHGLRIELTEFRRGGPRERPHYDFYCSLYSCVDDAVGDDLRAMVLSRYPAHGAPTDAHLFLCMSHRTRMRVNARRNAQLYAQKKEEGETQLALLEPKEDLNATMATQRMWIWPGLELLGASTTEAKKGVYNGVSYEVVSVDTAAGTVQIRPTNDFEEAWAKDDKAAKDDEDEDGEDGEDAAAAMSLPRGTLTFGEAGKLLRLQHALTYYTVQGRTVRGRSVRLMDLWHRYFSMRHLIVGLSRVAAASDLSALDEEGSRDVLA